MIVEIIYVERIAVSETKDHSPVSHWVVPGGPDRTTRAYHYGLSLAA